ncbi:DNA polymerase III subunit alpha [Sphingorhabdus sp. EL138]|uniref:DNA polymerase III subunit alpha n=1 Tax=Sphingorhabdus sp. EL138 TaxID=2073156 RepID=UPI0025E5568E|nr:DNA polymerase III subunit alpha [Sphingorhabdus sp. EL138]
MAYVPFVPLRVYSAYTMLEGAIEPKAIGETAKKLGFPAIAICDRNGLYGVMTFQDGAKSYGVQPIIGALLGVRRPTSDGKFIRDWLPVFAQDESGYINLCRLVSMAHLDRPEDLDAHVTMEQLSVHKDGLIALTGGAEGAMARLLSAGQHDAASGYLTRLQALFSDRLYIELSRRNDAVEDAAEDALMDLAYARDIPLVATNPAFFAEPDFFDAHDAMLCISDGVYIESEDRRRSSRDTWIKTGKQMRELFADVPEALANTLVIAQRCAALAPYRSPILPSLAGDRTAEDGQLREDGRLGLEKRLEIAGITDPAERIVYFDRLKFEADVICAMGFPGYFLIVADFIKWAKEQDIAVGPGRGSGAGSLVAWALTITDLDPIKLGLLFERFLNPDRVSMPDFDIDFCETRRGEVIRYVQKKYGARQVAQIITFGKLKARAVLRDTGRVLQMSYGQVDRLCKQVPNLPADPWDLKRALSGVAELREEYRSDAQVKRLFDLAMKLEGLPRHSSTHAAGVVIGDRELSELAPLYRDPRSDMPVTQFDMKYVESAGLVKFDFLGLKTLSVLQKGSQMLAKRGVEINLDLLPHDDPAVYELLQRGDTVGVFQLESEGMRRTLAAVKPTNFGDIIALVSLYRPGPMDNIPMFGRRKNGEESIEYPHPLLESVLNETYGIFVYQEQVMQAAQILAGYSLGEADLLRRAMGKKIQAEMDAQRERFVTGCATHAISAHRANELFDLIDKFAGYGFNKSHAAAYAVLAYQTAWLKTHHPEEFYAASMCFDMHQTDKLATFIDDMRRLDVTCLQPDINRSEAEFTVETDAHGEHAVRYALGGIKNVGERAMEILVTERATAGLFKSLDDFANRVDPSQINRRSLENLAAAGAFDALDPNRGAVHAAAETILAAAQSARDSRESGQGGLFGEGGSDMAALRIDSSLHWAPSEHMNQEKDAFGFYFSAHPCSQYEALAISHGAKPYAVWLDSGPIPEGVRRAATMSALIEGVRWRESRKGKRFMIADFSDNSGQFSVRCFDDALGVQLAEWTKEAECLLLNCEMDMRPGDEAPSFTVKSVKPLSGLTSVSRLKMQLDVTHEAAMAQLAQLVTPLDGGRSELVVKTRAADGRWVHIVLGRRFQFEASLLAQVRNIDGIENAELAPLGPVLALVH